MRYRNLTKLTELDEFTTFIEKYQLQYRVIDTDIYIYTENILVYIYGQENESNLYYDIYSIGMKGITSLHKLERLNLDIKTYESIGKILWNGIELQNLNYPEDIEQDFIYNIKFIDKYKPKFKECDLSKYFDIFHENELRKQEFEKVLHKYFL